MKDYPPIPCVETAPDCLFESGHLWLLEKIDGAPLRFQLQPSGLIRFGDRNRVYDDSDDIPAPYQHAVRHVREHLERDALRSAVDDVEDVVFFGEATHHHTIEYDWERTPSFLGFDVWSATADAFRPPDTVDGIFRGIGLEPVNAIERELHTRDFDPDSYTVPESAWYDGPAAGVVIRNKRGDRAKLLHPDFQDVDETAPVDSSAEELAAEYATRRRLENVAGMLEDRGQSVTFETLYERVLEDIAREKHTQLYGEKGTLELGTFRSEVSALTRAFLEEWRDGE
ncbi:RNA ligase family protein [Natronorubrum sp. A-ect3]|uniref:RNA ligase family protein n=1 Tax=Natronorubrum sp. A-ect3 TaxID=3242698 RepID=UPI00359D41CD